MSKQILFTKLTVFLSAFIIFIIQLFVQYSADRYYTGLSLHFDPSAAWIKQLSNDSPLNNYLIPGDRLLSINGQSIHSWQDIFSALNLSFEQQAVFLIQRQDQIRSYRLPFGREINYHRLLFNALIIFIYLVIAYASARIAYISRGVHLLTWFSLSVALDIALDLKLPFFSPYLDILHQLIASLEFSLILYLASNTPKTAFYIRWPYIPYIFYLLIPGLHTGLSLIPLGLIHFSEPWQSWIEQIFVHHIPEISWGLLILSALFYQRLHSRDNREKNQILWFMWAILPWFILQILRFFIPFGWFLSYELDNFVRFLFPIFIFISIFRYNFLNISDLFPRHIFHLIISLSIILILLNIIINIILKIYYLGLSSLIWLTGISCTLLGLSFNIIYRMVEKLCYINRYYYDLSKKLGELVDRIVNMDDLDKIRYMIINQLKDILKSKHIVLIYDQSNHQKIFWPDGDKTNLKLLKWNKIYAPIQLGEYNGENKKLNYLYTKGLELIIPLHHNEQYIGVLLIGRHIAGHRYLWRDIELLYLFAQNIAMKITNIQLNRQVQFDALTGTLRREFILNRLNQLIQCVKKEKNHRSISLGMMDIDYFKNINDQYGHLFGDEALKKIAIIAQKCLPNNCLLGRFGGEEFLIIMPDYGLYCAKLLAEKMRQSINQIQLNEKCRLSVSIGLAEIKEIDHYLDLPEHVLVRQLLDKADQNLYRAKQKGRNQVVCSSPLTKSCCPLDDG